MAFIFVPNPDGSFTEGDKQVNPDTGVEYCYIDGAWRALGPKIEDSFDTLDERYVKLEGTTVLSDYFRLKGPNAAGTGTSTFQVVEDGKLKLYNVQTASDSNTGWAANVEYVQNAIEAIDSASVTIDNVPPTDPNSGDLWFHSGEADLKIYYTDDTSSQWIPASTPPDPYDENFVSTSGDTMTGSLTMDNSKINIEGNSSRFYAKNDDGDIKLTIFGSGLFIADNTIRSKRINNGDICFAAIKTDGVDSANDVYKFKVTADGRAHSEYTITSSSPNKTLVNKLYFDQELEKISDAGRPKGMPGTRYKYSSSAGSSMPDGTFHIGGSGELYISRISLDGIEQSSYQTDDFSSNVKFMCHVRGSDKRVLHSIATGHWYQGVGSNKHIKFDVSTLVRNGKSEMEAGKIYYITDGIFNF